MTANYRTRRDEFTFSLDGARVASGYTFVPAIDDKLLGKAWDRQLASIRSDRPKLVHQVEDFLARFFATGCRDLG